jgi:regulator of sigma E protease
MLEIIFIIFMMFFLFGITIFVHEFGHFFVARKLGLVVETFSIGMGPALWKKEVGGITYKIGAFPIGGYVSLPQLDPEGMERMQGENESDRDTLPEVSPWKKIAVSFAGPLCNIAFAFVLAWIVFISSSQPILEETSALIGYVSTNSTAYAEGVRAGDTVLFVNETEIDSWADFIIEGLLRSEDGKIEVTLESPSGSRRQLTLPTIDPQEHGGQIVEGVFQAIPCLLGMVIKDSPADAAGIQPNDIVVTLAGTKVIDWFQFTQLIQEHGDQEIEIELLRGDSLITTNITPKHDSELDRVIVGVQRGDFRQRPWEQVKSDSTILFRTLKGLVTPRESKAVAKQIGGPVKIFQYLFYSLQAGLLAGLTFVRLININLAVMNLLPIPVLDGGHIVFSLWEGITRKKIPTKVITTLIQIFAVLLITLMILLTWRDSGGNKLISKLLGARSNQTEAVEEAPAE